MHYDPIAGNVPASFTPATKKIDPRLPRRGDFILDPDHSGEAGIVCHVEGQTILYDDKREETTDGLCQTAVVGEAQVLARPPAGLDLLESRDMSDETMRAEVLVGAASTTLRAMLDCESAVKATGKFGPIPAGSRLILDEVTATLRTQALRMLAAAGYELLDPEPAA
ncbi:MAG: hypothetical protein AAF561_00615 [Planctomycetota bacterium]